MNNKTLEVFPEDKLYFDPLTGLEIPYSELRLDHQLMYSIIFFVGLKGMSPSEYISRMLSGNDWMRENPEFYTSFRQKVWDFWINANGMRN